MLGTRLAALLAVVTGMTLELGVHAVSGRREAWDSEVFWTTGLPIALLVSFAIGMLSARSAWLATLAVAPAQVMTMMVRGGDIGTLWPLTVILSSILSAPFVVASFAGSRVRRLVSRPIHTRP